MNNRITVDTYADNGFLNYHFLFNTSENMLNDLGFGVNNHHQNGVAKRSIRAVSLERWHRLYCMVNGY